MSGMFRKAISFSSDVSGWNVSSANEMGFMFSESDSFNSDISGWKISRVRDMDSMLNNAKSFNQNLCAWGDKFRYDNSYNVFVGSGCTYQDDPQFLDEHRGGPFCACNCTETQCVVIQTTEPAVSTNLAPQNRYRWISSLFVLGMVAAILARVDWVQTTLKHYIMGLRRRLLESMKLLGMWQYECEEHYDDGDAGLALT